MLEIDRDKVCYIIVKAREYFAKEAPATESEGSNPADESFREVLEDLPDDPVAQEIKDFVDGLNDDETAQIIALAWIGRGTYGKDEFEDAVAEARSRMTPRTAEYLLGMPLVADYLEEGLAQFDLSCEGFEMGHL